MKYPLPALALAAACALPVILAAQSKPIDAYVSVVDAKGEPATGLTPADFRVREDGVTREVLKVGPPTEPLTVALLVDDSEAASPRDPDDPRGDGDLRQDARREGGNRPRHLRRSPHHRRSTTRPTRRSCWTARTAIFPRTGAGADLLDTLVEVSKGMQKRKPARPTIVGPDDRRLGRVQQSLLRASARRSSRSRRRARTSPRSASPAPT